VMVPLLSRGDSKVTSEIRLTRMKVLLRSWAQHDNKVRLLIAASQPHYLCSSNAHRTKSTRSLAR